jgi:hypothetical protein
VILSAVLMLMLLGAAPDSVAISSRVVTAGAATITVTFQDLEGEHRVLFTEHALATKKGLRSKRLTVVHQMKKDIRARWTEVWDAKDFVNGCEFDVTVALNEKSISVTDVDGNGKAEISFVYQLGCRSDVSPLTLKLLMYEGKAKYALRGETRTKVGEEESGKSIEEGGSHQEDPAFEKAPPVFLEHAKAQWELFSRTTP